MRNRRSMGWQNLAMIRVYGVLINLIFSA